jgi:hypothetical protein
LRAIKQLKYGKLRYDRCFYARVCSSAGFADQAQGHSSAREGNVTAQIFYLKNRSPENWNDRRHIEEKRRHVKQGVDINAEMTPQEAAQSYADTLRSGQGVSVIPMKRQRR